MYGLCLRTMLNLLSYKTTVYFISKRSLRLQRLDGFYFSSFAALNLYGEWKQLSTKRTNSSAFPLTDESIYFFFLYFLFVIFTGSGASARLEILQRSQDGHVYELHQRRCAHTVRNLSTGLLRIEQWTMSGMA